jgi:hypothetical protein
VCHFDLFSLHRHLYRQMTILHPSCGHRASRLCSQRMLTHAMTCRWATDWNLVHVIMISSYLVVSLPPAAISVRLPLNELRKSKVCKVLFAVSSTNMMLLKFYTVVQPLSRVPFQNRVKYFSCDLFHVCSLGTDFFTSGPRSIFDSTYSLCTSICLLVASLLLCLCFILWFQTPKCQLVSWGELEVIPLSRHDLYRAPKSR